MKSISLFLSIGAFASLGACGDDDGGNLNHNDNQILPICGNGAREAAEVCDGADLGGTSCTTVPGGFTGGALACNGTCDGFETSSCTGGTTCGDGVRAGDEVCDGVDLGGASCTTVPGGFTGGALACDDACTGFDTSACVPGGWTCDPTFYGTADGCDCGCGGVDPDCGGSTLDLCEYCDNLGSCSEDQPCPGSIDPVDNARCIDVICGDGLVTGNEECDGIELGGLTCADQPGYIDGTLACNTDDCSLDYSGCLTLCGDGHAAGWEECDGAEMAFGETCVYYGFAGGTLACTDYCEITALGCTAPVCGDGVRGGFEVCDGADLAYLTGYGCTDFGFTGGTLACRANCKAFDLGGCTGGSAPAGWTCPADIYGDGFCNCGCGILDPDCADATIASCSLNSCGGLGGCGPDFNGRCPGFIDPIDNTRCIPTTCGDGVRNGNEICEGADLGWRDCIRLGFAGGELACGTDCQLDTAGCTGWVVCGDGVIEGDEECDGGNLNGVDCITLGYLAGGTLTCEPGTFGQWGCVYDTSGCVSIPAYCGDGVCDVGEDEVSCPGDCRPDGSPCTDEAQCVSGNCWSEAGSGYPGGVCSTYCTLVDGICPAGMVCIDWGWNDGYGACEMACGGGCRSGYACMPAGNGVACEPYCHSDGDCPDTGQCNPYSWYCTTYSGAVNGTACTDDTQCSSEYCETTYPGGSCASDCLLADRICPAESICIDYGWGTWGFCEDSCANGCRAGWGCYDSGDGGRMACYPN